MKTSWKEHAMSLTMGDGTRTLLGCIAELDDISETVSGVIHSEKQMEEYYAAVAPAVDKIMEFIEIRIREALACADKKGF